jgi:RimJ/RimL family protein N-acetyltransferase
MLDGERITLRPPRETDHEFLARMRNDVDLQWSLGAAPRPNSLERVKQWLNRFEDDPKRMFFVIAEPPTGRPLGFIQLVAIHPLHGFGELGICLDRSARGSGAAQDALRLLENYARNVFNLRKITLRVLTSNHRAIGFYEKTGYLAVGVYRQHWYHGNAYHDVLAMEKLLT